MNTPQERAKALANKIADGSIELLSDTDITNLQQLLSSLSLNSPANPTAREPKVNDPRPFSGVNADNQGSNHLENFITQLNMVFRLQASRYPDDLSKVFYAASFMKDLAFEWVQPYIAAVGTKDEHPLVNNYSIFCQALRKMFGNITLVSEAENRVMRSKQGNKTAAEFTTEFKRYAVLTEFNEPALFWAYRNNINTSLQDELIVRDTPTNLSDYQDLVINLDLLLRERKGNKDSRLNRKSFNKNRPDNAHNFSRFDRQSSSTAKPVQHNHYHNNSDNDDVRPMEIDNASNSRGNNSKKGKKKFAPLSESEKQRRRDLNLCSYCGNPNHDIDGCTVKPAKISLNATHCKSNNSNKPDIKANTKTFYTFQDFQQTQRK